MFLSAHINVLAGRGREQDHGEVPARGRGYSYPALEHQFRGRWGHERPQVVPRRTPIHCRGQVEQKILAHEDCYQALLKPPPGEVLLGLALRVTSACQCNTNVIHKFAFHFKVSPSSSPRPCRGAVLHPGPATQDSPLQCLAEDRGVEEGR